MWFSVTFSLLPETRDTYAFFVRHYWLMALQWWASWEKMCRIISATRTVLALTGHILSKIPWISRWWWLQRCSSRRPRKKILVAREARGSRVHHTSLHSHFCRFLGHPLFFSPFSVVRPIQIFSIFKTKFLAFSKQKKSNGVVKPFFIWNNYFNLKNEHSNSIEKNRNIFCSILCILLIQICEC